MISDIDRRNLLNLNPELNVLSIPAGIDSSLLRLEKKETIPFSLVHVGHTDWYPNYDGLNWFVSEVMPELVIRLPEIKLFIYGGGKTKDFKVPPPLKKYVQVVGYVENLWEELKDKSLAIVPLRIGSGIRLKILELLATGTNLITTSIGMEGIDIKDGQEVIVANSKEEFKERIINFFYNGYDRKSLCENGRKFINDNYVWKRITERFETEYEKLLSYLNS